MTQRNTTRRPQQLSINFAPAKVRKYGLKDAHVFPQVSKGKQGGRFGGSWHEEPVTAWTRPQIELRTPNTFPALVLDLDGSNALYRLLESVEREWIVRPSWTVTRKSTGGTHVVWTLAIPVHRGEQARLAPLQYLARISEYYAINLQADPGYRGVLTHNPMSKAHGPGFVTNWMERSPRTLGQLGKVIPFGWKRPKVAVTPIGRNCSMFETLMKWAGKPENQKVPVLTAAHAINGEIGQSLNRPPLDQSELAQVVRSVEKYRREWIAEGRFYSSEQTRAWAQERQARGVANRRKRHNLDERDQAIVQDRHVLNLSYRAIAKKWDISHETVRKIILVSTLLHR